MLATTLHHDYITISLPVHTEGSQYKPIRSTPASAQMVSLKEILEKKVTATQKSVTEELARRRVPLKKDIPSSLKRETKEMRKKMATLDSKGVTALGPMEVAEEVEEEEEEEGECSYYTLR